MTYVVTYGKSHKEFSTITLARMFACTKLKLRKHGTGQIAGGINIDIIHAHDSAGRKYTSFVEEIRQYKGVANITDGYYSISKNGDIHRFDRSTGKNVD